MVAMALANEVLIGPDMISEAWQNSAEGWVMVICKRDG